MVQMSGQATRWWLVQFERLIGQVNGLWEQFEGPRGNLTDC